MQLHHNEERHDQKHRRDHSNDRRFSLGAFLDGLYSALERMRLTSSDEVRRLAEKVVLHVIEVYAAPDRSFDELRQHLDRVAGSDPLKDFSEACRQELLALQDATIRR